MKATFLFFLFVFTPFSHVIANPPKIRGLGCRTVFFYPNGQQSVKTVKINPALLNDERLLKSMLIKSFDELKELKEADIMTVKLVEKKNIKNFGLAKIYKIVLSDKLPEVFPKTNYFIVGERNNLGALFLLDSLVFIKTSNNDLSYLLAGVAKVKAFGYFKIYNFKVRDSFDEILNTLNCCENGLPIFNNSLDCISYSPAQFQFKNIDINHDGLLDIVFSGVVASYCKGLETGYGRGDRKPISKRKITICFCLKASITNKFAYELLNKKNACKILE